MIGFKIPGDYASLLTIHAKNMLPNMLREGTSEEQFGHGFLVPHRVKHKYLCYIGIPLHNSIGSVQLTMNRKPSNKAMFRDHWLRPYETSPGHYSSLSSRRLPCSRSLVKDHFSRGSHVARSLWSRATWVSLITTQSKKSSCGTTAPNTYFRLMSED